MPASRFSTRGWAIFAVCCLGFVISMFYRMAITVIAVPLARDLGLSTGELSMVSAVFFIAFGFSQLPLGPVLDRLGIRWPMGILMLLGACGALIFALSESMAMAVTGRILLGVGMCPGMIGAFALFARWFPPQRFATTIGLFTAIGVVGNMLASTPLALLAQKIGWRESIMLAAALNFIQAGAFFWIVRDRPAGMPKPEPSRSGALKDLSSLWRRPSFLAICFTSFFRYGSVMAMQGLWAGPFLVYGLGFSQVAMGNAVFSMSLGYMVSLPLVGRLSDHWVKTRKWVAVPGLFAMGLLFLLLVGFFKGLHEIWACLWFFTVGVAFGPGQITFVHVKELTPPHLTATAMTGVNFLNFMGPSLLILMPSLFLPGDPRALSSADIFDPVWLFIGGGLVLAAILYSFVPDTRPGGRLAKKKESRPG